MPFKRNPIHAEKICSLARYLTQLPPVALENASHSYLERTLDDSANKRITMPESFLALDEIITTAIKLLEGLQIHEGQIQRNLETYAPFAASEAVLMKAVKKGANRQQMHETLREIAMKAWSDVQAGNENSMKDRVYSDKTIRQYLDTTELEPLFDVRSHIGTAVERTRTMVVKSRSR
jgi:adenylosuccinate lyase